MHQKQFPCYGCAMNRCISLKAAYSTIRYNYVSGRGLLGYFIRDFMPSLESNSEEMAGHQGQRDMRNDVK